MPLLICPECGSKVSSYASSCPSCGCPVDVIKKTSSGADSVVNVLATKEESFEEEYYGESFEKRIKLEVLCSTVCDYLTLGLAIALCFFGIRNMPYGHGALPGIVIVGASLTFVFFSFVDLKGRDSETSWLVVRFLFVFTLFLFCSITVILSYTKKSAALENVPSSGKVYLSFSSDYELYDQEAYADYYAQTDSRLRVRMWIDGEWGWPRGNHFEIGKEYKMRITYGNDIYETTVTFDPACFSHGYYNLEYTLGESHRIYEVVHLSFKYEPTFWTVVLS